MTTNGKDYVPQERASLVAWKMAAGKEFTVSEVADEFGMTYQGARRLLNTISRVVPIYPNSTTGAWRRFDAK